MKQELSLLKRFLSDTPDFWKKLDMVGLFLVAVATALGQLNVPVVIVSIIASIGGTLTLISKFAVKDVAALESTIDKFPDIPSLVKGCVAAGGPISEVAQAALELKNQQEAVVKTMSPALDAIKSGLTPIQP